MKKWLLPVVILIVLAGGGAAVLLLGWVSVPGLTSVATAVPEKEQIGPIVKLPGLIINLKEENGRSYLKTTIALELAGKDRVEEVTQRMSLLTDLIILMMGDKGLEDLKPLESKELLKQELLSKINQQFPSKTIQHLYFDEFLYE